MSNHFHCKRPRGNTPQFPPTRNFLISTHELASKILTYQGLHSFVMSNLDLVTGEIFSAICATQLARHLEGSHSDVGALDVGFLEQLFGVHSLFGINFEHHFHNSLRVAIQQLMVSVGPSLNPLIQILFTYSAERKLSCDHYIE